MFYNSGLGKSGIRTEDMNIIVICSYSALNSILFNSVGNSYIALSAPTIHNRLRTNCPELNA